MWAAMGKRDFIIMEAFEQAFELSNELRRAISDMGYEQPTPIQLESIPPMLEGRDVIGQAQTGTGKTAAFGIPLVDAINPALRQVQALVLCPTRELALQTAGELCKLARYRAGVRTLAVYGGQPIERQLQALSAGVQVVVGTPGRVMDHMRRGSLDLSGARMVVLDEADEMLDMGFRDDIETILNQTNPQRQTALFSATMPYPILQLSKRYLKDPVHVKIANRELTVEKISQAFISVRPYHKVELLSRLLVRDEVKRALVFCNTKRCVEEVVTQLQARSFAAAGLHGDMRQIERDAIMARFRQGTVGILVATDVAARGLDIDDVQTVFNYDLPQDVEYYIHRVGRTGRAGREGKAYSFVVDREVARMWEYRKITGAKILCEQAPSGQELRKIQIGRQMEQILSRANGELDDALLDQARQLLEAGDALNTTAAMLAMLMEAGDQKTNDALDIRPPMPARSPRPAARSASAAPRRAAYAPQAPARGHGARDGKQAGWNGARGSGRDGHNGYNAHAGRGMGRANAPAQRPARYAAAERRANSSILKP